MRIETAVTRLLGAALPLAVSQAGGLGVIGAGSMRLADLARTLDEVQAGTDRPYAVNMPLYRQGADEVLDLLVERRVPVLIASQGGPRRYLDRFKAAGTICIHVVAGVEHALKAAEAGVDGLVVVGGEAGGHPPAELVSTLVVVRAVVRALSDLPVIASGGFADGAGLAAALALGAGAANFGTRFIATPEAAVHPAYKQAVLEAGIGSTRTVGRGFGMIRTLSNPFAERIATMEADGAAAEDRKAAFSAGTLKMAALDGDVAEGKIEAGQSAGLVQDLVPAGELVRRIAQEYCDAVGRLPRAG